MPGQICMSTEKIVLDNKVADAFLTKFAARADGLPAGDPRGHVVLGACISTDAVRRVADLIKDATGKGAKVLAGGPSDGPIMKATVARPGDAGDAHLRRGVVRAGGLASSASTARRRRSASPTTPSTASPPRSTPGTSPAALRVAQRIESGICHINGPTVHDEAQMPFGGTKASGYGRFGGKAAIDEFTELRWITIQTEPMHYPF